MPSFALMLRTSPAEQSQRARSATPPAWWLAATLVLVELAAAIAGQTNLLLAAAALVAPGFALTPLLPPALTRHPVAQLTVAPVLGLAVTALPLISLARLGVPLNGVTVRVTLVVLLAIGWCVPRQPRLAHEPTGSRSAWRVGVLLDAACLAAVVALALILGWRVIGTLPVPGDDWAKYLLYADEIRRHGALLLDNTLWMGGRPFSEDPGVPSLQGAALLMTGDAAGSLVRTILVLQLLGLAAAFGVARAWFGRTAAVVAGALIAVAPATQNMLGWHGLANVGALCLMVLVLAQLGAWLADGGLDRRSEVGLAITLVGVAAFHRFTALFLAGTLLLLLATAALLPDRRALLLSAARTAAFGVAGGVLVALDLRQRAADAGGTLPYTSYLGTKVDLQFALRDITVVLALLGLIAAVALIARGEFPRRAWPALAMALATIALGFGYLIHLPLYYSRITFFMPLPLALLAAAGAGALTSAWLARPRSERRPSARTLLAPAALAAACGMVLGSMTVVAARQADKVRDYYGFASPAALDALNQLSQQLQPREVVATDRCWSFLATWLLHTRTYPALEPQDIQPKAELAVARKAASILHGSPRGRALMRSVPVRYAVLDPTCPVNGRRFRPPGTLLYAGSRMAIIALDPHAPKPSARSASAR